MKFIKNNQRSCLSQLHLDNALHIGLETRVPSGFPFVISLHQELVIAFCANKCDVFNILNSIGIVAV